MLVLLILVLFFLLTLAHIIKARGHRRRSSHRGAEDLQYTACVSTKSSISQLECIFIFYNIYKIDVMFYLAQNSPPKV